MCISVPLSFLDVEKPEKLGTFLPGFPGFSALFGCRIPSFPGKHRILESQESGESFLAFQVFLQMQRKAGKAWSIPPGFSGLSGCRILGFPGKHGILENQESRKLFQAFHAFLHLGES